MSENDIAVLGLQVKSESVQTATSRLDKLTQSADQTEKSTEKLNSQLDNSDKKLKATSKSAMSLQKVMGMLGIAMAGAYVLKTITDFEQSMASVRAITRATGDEFDKLRDKAKELGANTRFTTAQAAEAMRYLGQAGLQTNEILVASQDVLRLAQAGGLDLASAAEIASKALRGFGLEASQMNEVADLMAKAFTASNTNVQELGEAFKYVAPVAKAFNVSMVDTTAAIAALSDAGISSTMAGSSLRNIMTKLANPTNQAKEALLSAGLTMDKLDIKTRGLIPVLETLANSTLSVEQAFTIFGQRGGPAFEVLKQAIPKIQKFSKEWQDLTGFAEETARIMDDNLQGALKRLTSALEYLFIQGSESAGLITLLQKVIDGFAAAILAIVNSPFTKWLDKVVVALSAYIIAKKAAVLWTKLGKLGLDSYIVSLRLTAATSSMTTVATTALTKAFVALRTAMMALAANPLIWIATVAAGVYALISNMNKAKTTTQEFREAFLKTNITLDETNKKLLAQKQALQDSIDLSNRLQQLDEYKKKWEEVNKILQEGLARDLTGTQFSDLDYMTNHLKTFKESITGIKKETKDVAKIVNEYTRAMNETDGIEKQTELAKKYINILTTLQQEYGKTAAITQAMDLITDQVGGIHFLAEKTALLNKEADEKNRERVKKWGDEWAESLQEIDQFLAQLNARKFSLPSSLDEAEASLKNFTSGTKSAQEEQWQLEKEAAAVSLGLMWEAAALAAAAGEMDSFMQLTAEAAKYQARFAEAVADYDKKQTKKSGTDKGEDFKNTALTKQQELLLKIRQAEVEVSGAGEHTLRIYQLQVEQKKELEDFNRRAEKAGMLNNETVKNIQQLNAELYALKIKAAEFAAEWEIILTAQQDSIDLMNALGASSGKVTLEYKKLQREMVKSNELLDPAERVRQLKLIDAELIKLEWDARFATTTISELYAQYEGDTAGLMAAIQRANATEAYRHELYNTTIGQQNELLGQLDALKIAYDEGGISIDMYNSKFVEMQLQLAQLRQDLGESTFIDDVNLALGSVVEGYEGLTKGLTNAWGGFFTSFTQGFSDSIGKAIMQSEDLGEALSNIAKDALANLISQLIQLGIQWAVNAAISQAIAATTASTAATTGTAAAAELTAAWTPAATAANIASFGAASLAGTAGMLSALAVSKAAYTIGGFKKGGFTGNMGTNEIAGLVHGGEYVMDAGTVKNIGIDNLDSLRAYSGSSGATGGENTGLFNGTSTQLNVIIENYASGIKYDVEKLSESEVRVIAREEAEDVVNKETPKLVASEINNPSSKTSKALNQNYSATRKH